MPLVLIAVGIALVIAATRGTLQTGPNNGPGLLGLLYNDFVGPGNFFAWIVAIGLVGAVGYIRPLRPVSDAFMVLIIIVFLLAANKGGKDFFSSLQSQLVTQTANVNPTTAGQSIGGDFGSAFGTNPAFSTGNFSGSIPINDPSLDPFQLTPIAPLGGI